MSLDVRESVKDYYGKVLKDTKDLKTDCCTAAAPPNYIKNILAKVPSAVLEKFYGCGNPIPLGIEGLDVLDLGCGAGRDCYISAALVGKKGSVTGVDMTEEMLNVARKYIDEFRANASVECDSIRFLTGFIEDLEGAGVAPESIDLATSNCVVNLSCDKRAVMESVYKSLRNGGEFYFSDLFLDRKLSTAARNDPELVGECAGGALYLPDFIELCHEIGFKDARVVSAQPVKILDSRLLELLDGARISSVTFRLFKLPKNTEGWSCLRSLAGHVAVYKGTIANSTDEYIFDEYYPFKTGMPVVVDTNASAILTHSWLKKHFDVKQFLANEKHFGPAFNVPTILEKQRWEKAFSPPLMSFGGEKNCCAKGEDCC